MRDGLPLRARAGDRELIGDHDVVVHPGYFYDFAETGRLVVSLLPEPARFARALERIVAVIG